MGEKEIKRDFSIQYILTRSIYYLDFISPLIYDKNQWSDYEHSDEKKHSVGTA